MELAIFIGIQATGKSTFWRERMSDTHVRLNMDMLKTRRRERLLFEACLEAKQPVAIDNTNPAVADRARYIVPARAARFAIKGYFFESVFEHAERRNAGRPERERVPLAGLKAVRTKLELPSLDEGFDELFFVRIAGEREFAVEEWRS